MDFEHKDTQKDVFKSSEKKYRRNVVKYNKIHAIVKFFLGHQCTMVRPFFLVRSGGLFDVEDEAFEVFAFGVIDVDGMVGGLCELVEDAHAAAGFGSG